MQQPEGKPRVQEKEEAKGAGRTALSALTTAPLLVGDRLSCLQGIVCTDTRAHCALTLAPGAHTA